MAAETVPGFTEERFEAEGQAYPVHRAGDGPAVIVIPEVPGITPQVRAFALRVVDAGFSVYVPELFGEPMRPMTMPYALRTIARLCVGRTFHLLAARESSPAVDWLRALARDVHERHGGPGVGAVGMCITGNFALGMMLDAPVIAPVLSQPSLPVARGSGLHASDAAIAEAHRKIDEEGAAILGLRFKGDPMCPAARFKHLKREFGDAFEAIELDDATANPDGPWPPHSVLTNHLIDAEGEPTRAALDRTLAFLGEHLRPEAA